MSTSEADMSVAESSLSQLVSEQAPSSDQAQGNTRPAFKLVIVVLVLLLIGGVIVVILGFTKTGNNEEGTGDDSDVSGGSDGSSGGPSTPEGGGPVVVIPVTTRAPVVQSTTSEPAVQYKELVCTVGADAAVKKMYPDDGVCNYLYFTPIIVEGNLRPQFQKNGWLMFQQQMKPLKKTGGGIGFDVHSLTLPALQNSTTRAELEKLAKENVKHYGLLNVIAQHKALVDLLTKARDLLHEFKALQGNDPSRKTILAVGLFNYSQPDAWEAYTNLFKEAVEQYEADTVIAMTSTGYLESEQNCVAVPPLAITSQNPAYPSLERHGELVNENVTYKNSSAVVGISFELAVLLYHLQSPTNILDNIPYQKCKSASLGDAEILCVDPVRRKSLPIGRVGYSMQNSSEHVFIGEYGGSLKEKVEYIKTLGLRKKISWLVFNVHLTTLRDGICVSPFFRLGTIRNYLNSL